MGKNTVNLIRAAMAAAILLFAQPGLANCVQSNLTGVWYLQGFSQDPFNGENENFWCKVQFSSTGAVVAGNSSCNGRVKATKEFVNVVGGKLTLNNACRLIGRIRFSDGVLTVDSGYMDSQKSVISLVGVGEAPDNWHVVFTGVKK